MKEEKTPDLSIEGTLPFEDYASDIAIGDLVKILVNRKILNIEDYKLLVMRGHMVPRLKAMNDSNWQDIKGELLEFLHSESTTSEEESSETA